MLAGLAATPRERGRPGEVLLPLRLCPGASVPSDGVSRCTGSGVPDRRTSRSLTPGEGAPECLGTPEVGRREAMGASPGSALANPPVRHASSFATALVRAALAGTRGNKKARILSESGPLRPEQGGGDYALPPPGDGPVSSETNLWFSNAPASQRELAGVFVHVPGPRRRGANARVPRDGQAMREAVDRCTGKFLEWNGSSVASRVRDAWALSAFRAAL